MTGTRYHRNMTPPVVNIIIGRALPDPGLKYAECKYYGIQQTSAPVQIIPLTMLNSMGLSMRKQNNGMLTSDAGYI